MTLKAQAKLKSRRGMLELDIILQRFLENGFDDLSFAQQVLFLKLLDWEDPILYDCLIDEIPPVDIEMGKLVRCIIK